MSERLTNLSSFAARLPARTLLALIRVYRRAISPALPVIFGPGCGCRFAPTCSHYAAEAVRTHGAWHGTGWTLRRLVKCAPWHAGGFDPVPPARPTRPVCRTMLPRTTLSLPLS